MPADERPQVTIYTDGGADPNPGPGGWGAVLVSGLHTKEISGADPATTNNRMELTAAIAALRHLKQPCDVTIFTDSQYLRNGITQWVAGWQARGWLKANRQPVENVDLWKALLAEVARHHVRWEWVRGHRGNPLNERADKLVGQARRRLRAGQGRGMEVPITPREADARQMRSAHPVASDPQDEVDGMPEVHLFTRGCALAEPGPAAYAAVLLYADGRSQAVSRAWEMASSATMELWAVVAGLRALRQPSRVVVHTASPYVREGAINQLADWERNLWRVEDGQLIKDAEIWRELALVMGDHDVSWVDASEDQRNPHVVRAAKLAANEARRIATEA